MVPSTNIGKCLVITSLKGTLTSFCLFNTFWKAGVSCSFKRIYKPTNTRIALEINGIRQPHVIKACSDIKAFSRRNEPVARIKPIGAPSCGNMPYHARLPSGAFSVASKTAPLHSPPKPKPCPKRHKASSKGATMPIWA